ncbi:hypothetical protein M902_1261 [Bacteriovorax sp. BAL6_X]|uniref:hypothetical protein n=1 Tax=Bacteriovorax sp. BAL6_X TaxID=1201290 RepID=UPI0003860D38|nr:hypothetical protein [Bacteriovorax sp. BAL6_X]EPZ52546.1 hypothetical protein M902_1261 [Bacteriovorax sp. BAL6_X]
MNVDFNRPIESSLEDIIDDLQPFSVIDILTASGQVLGFSMLNQIDKDLNIVTLIPLVNLALRHLTSEKEKDLTFEDLRILCRKVASLNAIRQSEKGGAGEAKSSKDDSIDFLVRNEIFQGSLQEDISLVLSRLYIFLSMEDEWGDIDPNLKIEEIFGVNFPQLFVMFFGIIAILMHDAQKFPGIDFSTYLENANADIKNKIENIKMQLSLNSSKSLEELKSEVNELCDSFKDEISYSAGFSPLEKTPFVNIKNDKLLLPVPQFLINRVLDHLYLSLNQVEVELRRDQGRTDPYKTDFSKNYGNVVEKYVCKVLSTVYRGFDEEPKFKGSNNPGPDVVDTKQRLVIEVGKLVPYRKLTNILWRKRIRKLL